MGIRKPSETQIVKACLEYLRLRRIFCWRNNTGALPVGDRLVRFGRKGSGDVFALLPGGRFCSIEAKRPGNKPTAHQAAFAQEVRAAGGVALCVYSVGELEDLLRAEGVI